MIKQLDLYSRLSPADQKELQFRLLSVCPLDGKYRPKIEKLMPYISAAAEWSFCARVQLALMKGLVKFGKAEERHVKEVESALDKIVVANMHLLEEQITKHDQLAVIEEIAMHVSDDTYRRLHPGTTSYDILDTARSWMFKDGWYNVMRSAALDVAKAWAGLARSEHLEDAVQVGRTHNQHTSPLYYNYQLSCYAVDIVEAIERIDSAADNLEGKFAGITGSGSSVAEFVGYENFMEFEEHVVKDILGLRLCTSPTQIIPKGNLINFGANIIILNGILANAANTIRLLYSSEIQEVVSLPEKDRLGGSSADAGKNNPINWENVKGQYEVVRSGFIPMSSLLVSDHQRDLSGSVVARYEPQRIMAMTFEALQRTRKGIKNLYVIKDNMKKNLEGIRRKPSEAMTGIFKGHLFQHSDYRGAHDAVKDWAKKAQKEKKDLLSVAMDDETFKDYWNNKLVDRQKDILKGNIERYALTCMPRTDRNLEIVDNFY